MLSTQVKPRNLYPWRWRSKMSSEVIQRLLIKLRSPPRSGNSRLRVIVILPRISFRVRIRTVHMFLCVLLRASSHICNDQLTGQNTNTFIANIWRSVNLHFLRRRLDWDRFHRDCLCWSKPDGCMGPGSQKASFHEQGKQQALELTKLRYRWRQIDGVLTSKNAGGNCTYPSFMFNPQYHLRISPSRNTASMSRGTKTKVALTMQTSRDIPVNIALVWSQGERIDEWVAFENAWPLLN